MRHKTTRNHPLIGKRARVKSDGRTGTIDEVYQGKNCPDQFHLTNTNGLGHGGTLLDDLEFLEEKGTQTVFLIDLISVPLIYATDDKKYFGKYCIDYKPDTVPTIASFDKEKQAHDYLKKMHGAAQHKKWYPHLYQKEHPYRTCNGCQGYKLKEEIQTTILKGHLMRCLSCRKILGLQS